MAAASSQTATKPESKEIKQNTWETLLKRATQRTVYEDSTLIVLGNTNCGKSSLLKSFRGIVRNPDHPYVAAYSYIHVKNRHEADSDETLAHMAIWQLDKPSRKGLIPTFLKSSGLERAMFMIVLDLSQPWSMEDSLKTWIEVAENACKELMKDLDDDSQKELKLKMSRYMQTFVDASMKNSTDVKEMGPMTGESKIDPSVPSRNLGVPLVIVGAKGDYFSNLLQKSKTAGDRFEFATRRLRQTALKYGASVIFTSVAGQGSNMELLQDYIFHRMYGFEMKQAAKAAATVDSFGLYIPTGFDSNELIDSVRSAKSPFSDSLPFTKVFINPNKESKRRTEEEKFRALKNDKFYRLLQSKLTTARSSSSGRASLEKPSAPRPKPRSSSSSRSHRKNGSRSTKDGAPKNNHAVRQFFQSLLTNTQKGGGSGSKTASGEPRKDSLAPPK